MVDETEPGPPDKVKVRIIHLSPDAGVLNSYFLTDSGRRVVGALPQGSPTAPSARTWMWTPRPSPPTARAICASSRAPTR